MKFSTSIQEFLSDFKKFIFYYLDAKILLALIFIIFLICLHKFVIPFIKDDFKIYTDKIRIIICNYQQIFIYKKLIFLLIGSLTLTFLKKINLLFVKINYFCLNNYINNYFYIIHLILINIFSDFDNSIKFKKNIVNSNFFKNSLRNFFISYELIFIKNFK